VFNAIFSNISAISWRPVFVVEEAGIPIENHQFSELDKENVDIKLSVYNKFSHSQGPSNMWQYPVKIGLVQ
jgi:hypothetical protein